MHTLSSAFLLRSCATFHRHVQESFHMLTEGQRCGHSTLKKKSKIINAILEALLVSKLMRFLVRSIECAERVFSMSGNSRSRIYRRLPLEADHCCHGEPFYAPGMSSLNLSHRRIRDLRRGLPMNVACTIADHWLFILKGRKSCHGANQNWIRAPQDMLLPS